MWRFVAVGIAMMVISVMWYATMVAPFRQMGVGDGIVGLLTVVLAVLAYRSDQHQGQAVLAYRNDQNHVQHDTAVVLPPVAKSRTDVPTFMPVITATDVARWRQLAAPRTIAATPAITDRLPAIILPVTTPFHEWIVQPRAVAKASGGREVTPTPIDWQALGVMDASRPWYALMRHLSERPMSVAMCVSALWFVSRLMGW